jgi:cytochrome P450
MMIWELSRHPEILAKVREELDAAIPQGEVADWNTLFKLPYFNGFIKEGP